jgi:hypothetical protein
MTAGAADIRYFASLCAAEMVAMLAFLCLSSDVSNIIRANTSIYIIRAIHDYPGYDLC